MILAFGPYQFSTSMKRTLFYPQHDYSSDPDLDNKIQSYSVLRFFRDLKKEISSRVGYRINYRDLSHYLGYVNEYHVQARINKAKGNPQYTLVKRVLTRYFNNLERNLNKIRNYQKALINIENYFNKYRTLNEQINPLQHKNLITDYFESMDSVEKAYWLGWIFAEGHIELVNGEIFSVSVGVKDAIIMKKFIDAIGADYKLIDTYRKKLSSGKISRNLKLIIRDNTFIEFLKGAGVPSGAKSKIIRLPVFNDDSLAKAFLLGFFDGDGYRKYGRSPEIASSSIEFLEDIKNQFNELEFQEIMPTKDKNGNVLGHKLLLTPDFFNALLREAERNNLWSLPRKAIKCPTPGTIRLNSIRASKRIFRERADQRRLKVIELRQNGWTDWKKIFTEGIGLTWVSHNRARDYLKNWFSTDPAIMGLLSHYPDEDIYVLIEETYKSEGDSLTRNHII